MNEFKYTPDQEIEIHKENAIRHMCIHFLSHENGLPEWIKNSSAAYINEGIESNARIIIVSFNQKKRSKPSSISCLDFVGMTSEKIERDFRRWADPEAASRSSISGAALGELGGHGNGGKCYMTQMFKDYAYLNTVKNNMCCKYGVAGGTISLGYAPNETEGKDICVPNVQSELESCLNIVDMEIDKLPDEVASIAKSATGFTFIQGVNPKDCTPKIPIENLMESLLSHHQMITPVKICKIYITVNGKFYNNRQPLLLPTIEPIKGYEKPLVKEIPEKLKDPKSEQMISIYQKDNEPKGRLEIFTSAKNMRIGRGGRRRQ